MRYKTKSRNTFPHPSLLPRLNFTPDFLHLLSPAAQGDRERGLRSVHHTLSRLLLPPQVEDSSLSFSASVCGPSHGRQFSMNFSSVSLSHGQQLFMNRPSMGPLHGVQSFRNRLPQCGSPAGSTSPVSKPASAWASHWVTASFEHPPAPAWCPPRAAGVYLLHHGPQGAAGEQPASSWSSSWAARQFLLQRLEHLLPLLLH